MGLEDRHSDNDTDGATFTEMYTLLLVYLYWLDSTEYVI